MKKTHNTRGRDAMVVQCDFYSKVKVEARYRSLLAGYEKERAEKKPVTGRS